MQNCFSQTPGMIVCKHSNLFLFINLFNRKRLNVANTRGYQIKAPQENASFLLFSASVPRVTQTCQHLIEEVEVWSTFLILTRWGRRCDWHKAQGERNLWGHGERQTYLTGARQELSPRHHPQGSYSPLCLYCHCICIG